MGTYIDIYDVAARMQHFTFTASSDPSTTEVEAFIDEVESEMDARMNAVGITVPVTDADRINMLERIAVNGVIAEVLRSLDKEDEAAGRYQEMYEGSMTRIENNPAIIEETSTAYASPDGATAATRPFRRGERVW